MSRNDAYRQTFVEEARDLLSELEAALLELEENPEERDLVDRVFRAMHTLKGSGAMFGFEEVASFTHEVETVFDQIRSGGLALTPEIVSAALRARDHVQTLLQAALGGEPSDPEETERQKAAFRDFARPSRPASPATSPATSPVGNASEAVRLRRETDSPSVYRVRFAPGPDAFAAGGNPLYILDDLRELAIPGGAALTAHMDAIPPLGELDPERCHAWWDVVLTTTADENAIRDVFIFVEDQAGIEITRVSGPAVSDSEDGADSGAVVKKLGEILVERGDASPEDISRALEAQKPLGELLVASGAAGRTRVEAALAEQTAARALKKKERPRECEAANVRVAAEKLDALVDLVGELVIAQSRVCQMAESRSDAPLMALAEELERLTNELRDAALKIRMLPIGSVFGKLRRLVRDLSAELGKEVDLVTSGAEAELDKTVIEKLGDPLVHILRNSIDHGIETPDERAAKGKPRRGVVELSAEHAGGDVLIRIRDDGRGMDAEAIRAKAVERGLIAPDATPAERDLLNLVFQPGFSTASSVTSVSGRGVGMDVVKRSIDALRGAVDLKSEPGLGTTLTVKLPLTLAIIDGLQVRVGEEHYVIPLTAVEECVELAEGGQDKGRLLDLRGEAVPYLRLREWFETEGERPRIEQVVVVNVENARLGLVVDQVAGQLQTVIKTLGRLYRNARGVAGATVRGDGTMALILDVADMRRVALAEAGA